MQGRGQLVSVFNQPVMLGAGTRDADGVGLLKRVRTKQEGRHLTGQHDDRNAIHQCIGQTGHGIRGTGTRCHQRHAGFAGRTCIAISRMRGRLLVTHKDMLDIRMPVERVLDRQHRAAGVAKNIFDTLFFQ